MKTKILISSALMLFSGTVFGQFIFGVSPGLSFNGAYFGYKVANNGVVFVGMQFAGITFNYDQTGLRVDDFGNLVKYKDHSEFKGAIYAPNIGFKHYFKQKNKIRPYTSINFAVPIVRGKVKSGNADLDFGVNSAIKNIRMWGGEWGFGTEYFFDDNFSIGGEFGIRHLNVKAKQTTNETIFDPNSGNTVANEIKTEINTGISPTYTRFSLNFYF